MSDNFSNNLQLGLKRAIDIIIAFLALVLTSLIMLVIAILVKLDSPGPVFYRHRRVGRNGRPFGLYKFRTMVTGGDDASYMNYLRELIESAKQNPGGGKPYAKMKDDGRITKVGRFLRTYYLDELPQMLNVLTGEISLVGPRPHVQFEVNHYTPEQRRRLKVKPGMTGLWQVTGKADATFDELLRYDLEYIDNWSLGLDLKIIGMTILIMLRGGEAFWTRTSKRVPGSGIFSKNHHSTPNGDKSLEKNSEGSDTGLKRKLLPTKRRYLPYQDEQTINKISSMEK